MYTDVYGERFLKKELLHNQDVFKIAQHFAERMDGLADNWHALIGPLRFSYLSLMIGEGIWEVAHGKSIVTLAKEEVYSIFGSAAFAAMSQPLVDVTINCFMETSTLDSNKWLLNLVNCPRLIFPLVGMAIGNVAGTYLADNDVQEDIDISMSLVAARETRLAGLLRESLAAEFKDNILPVYTAEDLSQGSLKTYQYYYEQLKKRSTHLGQSWIKPLPSAILELSHNSEKFSPLLDLPTEFLNGISDEKLSEYSRFLDHNEGLPHVTVDGAIFRRLIEKHSDFSEALIKHYKTISKSLFVIAALDTAYEFVKADDKFNEVGRLAYTWSAAEAGTYIGVIAGTAVCGAVSPICIGGAALMSGTVAVAMAGKTWSDMERELHSNTVPGDELFKELPNAVYCAHRFFKPSNFLQRQSRCLSEETLSASSYER